MDGAYTIPCSSRAQTTSSVCGGPYGIELKTGYKVVGGCVLAIAAMRKRGERKVTNRTDRICPPQFCRTEQHVDVKLPLHTTDVRIEEPVKAAVKTSPCLRLTTLPSLSRDAQQASSCRRPSSCCLAPHDGRQKTSGDRKREKKNSRRARAPAIGSFFFALLTSRLSCFSWQPRAGKKDYARKFSPVHQRGVVISAPFFFFISFFFIIFPGPRRKWH